MNTTTDLQDVHCGHVKLADELEALPERCPCREWTQCSGECCCNVGPLELAPGACTSCSSRCVSAARTCGGRQAALDSCPVSVAQSPAV